MFRDFLDVEARPAAIGHGPAAIAEGVEGDGQAGLGGGFAFGHDGGDALAHEADDIVEQPDIVGIDQMILVQRRAEQALRNIFPGVDGHDAGHGERPGAVDLADARVGVR